MPDILPKLHALLKPGGFIGVTTWAVLGWHPLLARSIARMSTPPYCPSSAELEAKMFAGRPWSDKAYVARRLSEAGFENVDVVREKRVGKCGTPKAFMETMEFPMRFVTGDWDEGTREELWTELRALMLEEAVKDAGGEDEQVVLEFDANVGWGWKSG